MSHHRPHAAHQRHFCSNEKYLLLSVRETEGAKPETVKREQGMEPSGTHQVVVTDIRMSFASMVVFMVKWAIATISVWIVGLDRSC